MTRSGAPAASLPECKLFKQLQFLRDKVANRPTASNVTEILSLRDTSEQSFMVANSPISVSSPDPSPTPSLDSIGSQPRKQKANKTPTEIHKTMLITEKEHPDNFLYEELKENPENYDPDYNFAISIVPILKALPEKEKSYGKD